MKIYIIKNQNDSNFLPCFDTRKQALDFLKQFKRKDIKFKIVKIEVEEKYINDIIRIK